MAVALLAQDLVQAFCFLPHQELMMKNPYSI
jgi:hypothetical protein